MAGSLAARAQGARVAGLRDAARLRSGEAQARKDASRDWDRPLGPIQTSESRESRRALLAAACHSEICADASAASTRSSLAVVLTGGVARSTSSTDASKSGPQSRGHTEPSSHRGAGRRVPRRVARARGCETRFCGLSAIQGRIPPGEAILATASAGPVSGCLARSPATQTRGAQRAAGRPLTDMGSAAPGCRRSAEWRAGPRLR